MYRTATFGFVAASCTLAIATIAYADEWRNGPPRVRLIDEATTKPLLSSRKVARIRAVCLEGDPFGSVEKGTQRELSSITVEMRDNQRLQVESGDRFVAIQSTEDIPLGISFDLKLVALHDGKADISVKASNTSLGRKVANRHEFETTCKQLVATVPNGEAHRLFLAGAGQQQTWLALTIFRAGDDGK